MDKQHILAEIRRTAKANGGEAPGVRRFLTETGIKESDWHGKHWVRWGDAVREAGLTPNRMAEAYDEEVLIAKLICLTRELGQFPVEGDLRMKGRNDPQFPSEKAFRRLDSKKQRVLKVQEYCRTHEGFQDVLALCPEAVDRQQHSEKETVKKRSALSTS